MSKKIRGIMLSLVLAVLFTTAAMAGESGTCGDSLRWTLDDTGTLTITGTGSMESYGYSYTTFTGYVTGAPWFESRANLKSIVIQEGVTSIGGGAFASCTSVKSVSIPASVTSIGKAAFGNCTGLTSVTYAGTAAQWNAVSIGEDNGPLTSVSIQYGSGGQSGGGSTSERSGTFGDNMSWSLDNTGTLTISGTGELTRAPWYKYTDEIKSIVIRNGITKISSLMFGYYSSLEKILLPDTLETIDNGAFRNCSALTSVWLPDSIDNIGKLAFHGCTKLKAVVLPQQLSSIADYAFDNCKSLETVVFSENITSIGEHSFSECSSLKSIKIPSSVAVISTSAFSNCTGLTDVVLPDSVKEIAERAFLNCSSLKNLTIPQSVTAIGEGAFAICPSLSDVYYSGTESQWEAINIGSVNEKLTAANIHYESAYHLPTVPVVIHTNSNWSLYSFPYYEDSAIYCAAYDKDGKMLALDVKDYDADRFVFSTYDGADRSEFFFLDSHFVPQRAKFRITINYV